MKFSVWLPAMPPGTLVGWLFGSATNGTRLLALNVTGKRREVDAVVAVLVRQPDVRRPAGERADAAAQLLPSDEPPLRSQLNPMRGENMFGAGAMSVRVSELGHRVRVGIGHVREVRLVEPDAVGQRQVRLRAPRIPDIDAELPHRELGRLERIGGIREVVVEAAGNAGGEVVDAREAVIAVEVLDEDVQELEELVVRAEGEGVRPLQPGEIVGDLDHVLIEPVLLRRDSRRRVGRWRRPRCRPGRAETAARDPADRAAADT